MVSFDNALLAADELLTQVLSEWDIYSTAITGGIIIFFAYLALTRTQPDAHPFLLARQAQPSVVRHPGQSPVYRSHAAPHGLDLNTGLNVKDPGQNKWSRGRNGDLRDVWRKVIAGRTDPEGNPTGEKGRIITVLGSEQTIDHDLGKFNLRNSVLRNLLRW
jgi:hypothetical protein